MGVYLEGDAKDPALKLELEAAGIDVAVEVLRARSLEEGLVPAVCGMFGGKCPGAAPPEASADSESTPEDEDDDPASKPWWSQLSKAKVMSWFGSFRSHVAAMLSAGPEE